MDFDVNTLVGKVYGDLEVISYHHTESKENGGIHYICYCHKCGIYVIYTYSELKTNKIKDCGCSKCLFDPRSILNKKFGRLTPIDIKYKKENVFYYTCKCYCGNRVTMTNFDLLTTRIESCGCAAKEIFNFDIHVEKPNYRSRTSSYELANYYKKVNANKQKIIELESQLTINTDGKIIGKDGRIYPIRWKNRGE